MRLQCSDFSLIKLQLLGFLHLKKMEVSEGKEYSLQCPILICSVMQNIQNLLRLHKDMLIVFHAEPHLSATKLSFLSVWTHHHLFNIDNFLLFWSKFESFNCLLMFQIWNRQSSVLLFMERRKETSSWSKQYSNLQPVPMFQRWCNNKMGQLLVAIPLVVWNPLISLWILKWCLFGSKKFVLFLFD